MLFTATLLSLCLMLTLSALIPNNAIRSNMEQSALNYREADAFQFHNGKRMNSVSDNYADTILMNVSWHMGEGDPFVSALNTRYYDGGEYGESAGLYLSVTEGAQTNTDYTRYWHGSAVFIRLMHLFTDVNGIKIIGLTVTLLLAVLTMAMLVRRKHYDIAILLALSLAAVQVWNIRLSLEYQPTFVLAFLLCPLYLLLERRGGYWLTLLSVVSGTAIAFFDFLTTETITILLPLLLVTAVRAKEDRLGSFRESLWLFGSCVICWCTAYAGAFLVKWIAASIVTGENAFALAIGSAAERVGGVTDLYQNNVQTNIFSSILANLTVLFGGTARVQVGRALVSTGVSLMVLFSVWYLFPAKKANRTAAALLLILGAIVPVRYLILNNHSYLHEFFTYRALLVPILAMLLALRLNVQLPWERKVRK